MFTFTSHIKHTAAKGKKRVNVLKALAGTDWGQEKETITNTYKATCRSVLEYGSPIWSLAIKPTLWNNLQNVQNAGLRVAPELET